MSDIIYWQRYFTVEVVENIRKEILSKRVITDTGCWNWTGSTGGNRDGYGQYHINDDKWRVHRLVAMIWLNFNPDSLKLVCHKCDNRMCINPDHFFFDYIQGNMRDKINKRRHMKGEMSPFHKLTLEQVKQIKELATAGLLSQTRIAEMYGIESSTVSRIKTGARWNCSLTGELNNTDS